MDTQLIFGLSILMSLLSSVVVAKLYVWPRLRRMNRTDALTMLVAPHMFFRFIGLSFLVPGVVSPRLPPAFAVPAAYGDLIAGMLAITAIVALSRDVSWTNSLVWLFNVWGAADLLFAFYQGARVQLDPGALGAAFYIVTSIVPLLLVTHALIFRILTIRQ
jgi:hypothetical protein